MKTIEEKLEHLNRLKEKIGIDNVRPIFDPHTKLGAYIPVRPNKERGAE